VKPLPFDRVKVGQVFRDIDGTIFMRITRAFGDNDGRTAINCAILITNKPESDNRGDVIAKARDTYCEVLDERELSELKLIDIPEIEKPTI